MEDKRFTTKSKASETSQKMNICMISDFFYPSTGGVEIHMLNLAQPLIERGHKVIAVTHHYGDRKGVRYMSNGLKVYYIPIPLVGGKNIEIVFPIVVSPYFMGVFRFIMISEEIQVLHWHQSPSMLGYMAVLLSQSLGIRTVLTSHSLLELENPVNIMLTPLHNVIYEAGFLDHEISVSNAVRELETIRCNLPVSQTSVIPNAIDAYEFAPDPSLRNPVGTINIVFFCRLAFRKGKLGVY